MVSYVLFWAFIALFWFIIFFEPGIYIIPLLLSLIFTIALSFCVFVSTSFLIPKMLYANKLLSFIGLFFLINLVIGTLLTISIYKVYDIFWIKGALRLTSRQILYKGYLIPFLFSGTACSFKFWMDKIQTERNLSDLEKEKVKTELEFLKAQINPHFVFNSLNSIYVQIDQSVEGAKETLAKFSDLLRYQLYECETEQIAIEKEAEYLKNYVELQKIRRTKRYSISFNCSQSVKGFTISPILLITIIENAFKHVSNWKDKQNLIKICLSKENDCLLLSCENTKNGSEDISKDGSLKGIGLKNLKRRLDLIYPGKHTLDINEETDYFKVNLKIFLNDNKSNHR